MESLFEKGHDGFSIGESVGQVIRRKGQLFLGNMFVQCIIGSFPYFIYEEDQGHSKKVNYCYLHL